jgi:hypothetical protein
MLVASTASSTATFLGSPLFVMSSISYRTWSEARSFPCSTSMAAHHTLADSSSPTLSLHLQKSKRWPTSRAFQPYSHVHPDARRRARRTVKPNDFKTSMESAGWCLPGHIVEMTHRTLNSGWAPRTLTNHAGAVRRYEQFCLTNAVPAHLIWPAHEPVLCAFAADHAGRTSKSTAQNELAGIKAHHTKLNLSWADSPRIRTILEGVERSRPSHSLLPPRPPVTLRMIRALVEDLSVSPTSLDRAV